jgi:hypothetical protein
MGENARTFAVVCQRRTFALTSARGLRYPQESTNERMTVTRILTNPQDRDRLDEAVRAFVACNPLCRAAQIMRDDAVNEALGHLPRGKPGYRYVDDALQRLKRAKRIECDGSYWSAAKTRRRP